jgi:hypothetical protein
MKLVFVSLAVGLALALATGLSGCDRAHLSASYGTAVRAAFSAQIDPHPRYRAAPVEQGLDPEEAAIVLETYRRSLSPMKDAAPANRAPVLLLPAEKQSGSPPQPVQVQ